MGIAVPTQFVSTNDLLPTRNALSTMFAAINPITGALPESGPPLSQMGSDTYHMWTLIGTCASPVSPALHPDSQLARQTTTSSSRATRLGLKASGQTTRVPSPSLRTKSTHPPRSSISLASVTGHGSAEAGTMLRATPYTTRRACLALLHLTSTDPQHQVLTTASALATSLVDTALASRWASAATSLKSAFNTAFWADDLGMYTDNQTTTLCPQDANAFAVLFNLTTSPAQASRISTGLRTNWNTLGPVPPELPDTISPFISGFELQAHFAAGNDSRALDLLQRTWGYMLTTPLSVQSTLLEGFAADGSLGYVPLALHSTSTRTHTLTHTQGTAQQTATTTTPHTPRTHTGGLRGPHPR
ncbi:hypothetical protein C0992_005165 [Termitomyces sp. T32_za158]|nr:hypothetical protein C0992_005165 [Termitomyces sp. T32_za158]